MTGNTFLALLIVVIGLTMAIVGFRRRGAAFVAALQK